MNHLRLAHLLWKDHLKPGDIALDATVGGGRDTLELCRLALTPTSGWVYGLDIQEEALNRASELLEQNLSPVLKNRTTLSLSSHETLPKQIPPPSVIVYNLGYLPGGNKELTTLTETTLSSLENALNTLKSGGLITIMLYPGHAEGAREASAITLWLKGLQERSWKALKHQNPLKPKAPILISLQTH